MQYDIRRLDIYRKIPKDLTQPTYAGACISILSCVFMTYLFIAELLSFLSTEIVSDMYVADPTDVMEKISVEIDITLLRMDCKYIGLDIQDELGRHEVGFVEDTVKTPVGEGCRFKSKFKINKVPGNFHVSTHSSLEQPDRPDMAHIIHTVRFGDSFSILKKLQLPGSFNPLGTIDHSASSPLNVHEYFLKIVPSVLEDNKKVINLHQYTFAYKTYTPFNHGHQVTPVIWFRYDLNPITVRYKTKNQPLYSFLTTICAIVGGTFTVAGIIDSIFFTATELFKKAQLGKLN